MSAERKEVLNGIDADAVEEQQRIQSNKIFADYDRHYGDRWSSEYRNRFFYGPLFDSFPVRDKKVLDAMCGGGYTTENLLSKGAQVTGLDISEEALEAYRKRYKDRGCRSIHSSVLNMPVADQEFDAVVVIGGLHHIHPHVEAAVDEIHRVLRPGGHFYFMEPHAQSFFDRLRRVWYRHDPRFFAPNEAAIDLKALRRRNADRFFFRMERYIGSPAYLFVLNSGILRVPLWLKASYSPLLISLEPFFDTVIPGAFSFVVLAVWEKKCS